VRHHVPLDLPFELLAPLLLASIFIDQQFDLGRLFGKQLE